MKKAPLPENELQRLEALHQYQILDTAEEEDYDSIARLAAHVCGTSMSNISFVDRDRQWFKAAIGLDSRETPRDVAFCAHTILDDRPMIVEDAKRDERFWDNPLVTAGPEIRFYAGIPLVTREGYRLGALCAIDREPRTLTSEQIDALTVLSRHVTTLLDLRSANRRISAQNRQLEELSDLKSRLLSVIAHDLRSPLVNISSLLQVLRQEKLPDHQHEEVLHELSGMLASTDYLLDNVISWASRELSEQPFEYYDLSSTQLVEELITSVQQEVRSKGNTVHVDTIEDVLFCSDRNVLVFILRNLLTNANKFTDSGRIVLRSEPIGGTVRFSVSDTGTGMTRDQVEGLFDWSTRRRRTGTAGERGAGLALLFCKDFADRLGATLHVDSEHGVGTTVTLTVPVQPACTDP